MGMGYGSGYADVIQIEGIKSICQETFDNFIEAVNKHEENISEIASSFKHEDFEEVNEEIVEAYVKLQEDFSNKTELNLSINCHDSDSEGSNYDEVDGVFWGVHEMYVLSEAAKKLQELVKIERVHFVVFG
jgi:hypothetical protein